MKQSTLAGAGIATCPFCGEEFRPVAKGKDRRGNPRHQKYCSSDCYRQDRNIQPLVKAICRGCGGEFEARKDRTTYCSRECAFDDKQHRCIQCDAPMRGRKLERYCSELCRIASSMRLCKVCGAQFEAIPNQEICSRECHNEKARADYQQAYAKTRQPQQRVCRECGKSFIREYIPGYRRPGRKTSGDRRRSFCSDKCSRRFGKRISKAKRRAKERGILAETINPIAVFNHDNWTCQSCGVKTPRKLRGTYHPNAPELDHIIPLGAGGLHVWSNVQCLCRSCNQAKGMTPAGQLRMDISAQYVNPE